MITAGLLAVRSSIACVREVVLSAASAVQRCLQPSAM